MGSNASPKPISQTDDVFVTSPHSPMGDDAIEGDSGKKADVNTPSVAWRTMERQRALCRIVNGGTLAVSEAKMLRQWEGERALRLSPVRGRDEPDTEPARRIASEQTQYT